MGKVQINLTITKEEHMNTVSRIHEDIEDIEDYAETEHYENQDDAEFRYNIDTYTNAIPVERLVKDFTAKIIRIPPFQRPYVWGKRDTKTARHRPSLFIDSILQGLPTPPISIYKDATAREEGLLIDGQQRLTTLAWFINQRLANKPKVFKLQGEGINASWNNKTFAELPHKYQDFLLRAYIPVTYIRQLNEDKPPMPRASSLFVLFDRLNSGGVALAPHEKRSVLIIYNPTSDVFKNLFDAIYKMPEWEFILPPKIKTKNITLFTELIFRVYAFLLYKDHYNGNMAKFLDEFMLKYSLSSQDKEYLLKTTRTVLSELANLKQRYSKLFYPHGRFNTAIYESFVVAMFMYYQHQGALTTNDLLNIYLKVKKNKLYEGKAPESKQSYVAKEVVNKRIDDTYRVFCEA